MRLRGLLRKEFIQIRRDPSSIAIAFLMPVFLLLLFGYGVSMDSEHTPLAVVIEQPGAEAESFAAAFRQSPYFAPRAFQDRRAAEAALLAREVDAILVIPQDFAARLVGDGDAPIQLIVNGVDSNTARLMEGYVRGVWQRWLEQVFAARGQRLEQPVQLDARIWFNPEVKSRNFLVPGLVAIIMTLIGALLTAMVMAREWERGTMEALMVTPVTMREVLIGKTLPYFVLGQGGLALTVAMAVWLFEVPLRGSLWLLVLCSSLFLLVALGMGLLISVVTRNQFVAGMLALVTTFLPAFLLSGFIFDIGSMPPPVQMVTHVVAGRYLIAILQSLFLAGDVWVVILPNAAALALMAVFFFGVSQRKLRKRLD